MGHGFVPKVGDISSASLRKFNGEHDVWNVLRPVDASGVPELIL